MVMRKTPIRYEKLLFALCGWSSPGTGALKLVKSLSSEIHKTGLGSEQPEPTLSASVALL